MPKPFFRTYSPKGDWNQMNLLRPNCIWMVFQNLFPERGLKQCYWSWCRVGLLRCFSEPIPRKGTETTSKQTYYKLWHPRFSEPIPRKGTETLVAKPCKLGCSFLLVFQNLFPERGLKRFRPLFEGITEEKKSFSEPIPRKGTETVWGWLLA